LEIVVHDFENYGAIIQPFSFIQDYTIYLSLRGRRGRRGRKKKTGKAGE